MVNSNHKMLTMDYISQIEKLFKFLELNFDARNMQMLLYIKKRFNNDLNLFGCFIKDFIIVNTGKIPDDYNLYSEFVLFFAKNSLEKNITLLDKYSQCYLMVVFEDCDNLDILEAINTVNACYMMEAYPDLMKILFKYYHQKVDIIHIKPLLQSVKDYVIENFGNNNFLQDLSNNISDERFVS